VLIVQNSVEEVIASTAYLELFLRKVTDPGLLKTFLHFILLGVVDDVSIAETLTSRITSTLRVSLVTILTVIYYLYMLSVTLSSILLILETLPRPLGSYSGCVMITESDEYREISTSLLMQDVISISNL